MAFQSNGPVMLALPPFRGFTRRVVLVAGGVGLAQIVMSIVAGRLYSDLVSRLMLGPGTLIHGWLWQTVTYPFVAMSSLLSLLFALLTVWFFGSRLEDDFGSRWFVDYFFAATIGGAFIACGTCFVLGRWVPGLNVNAPITTAGLWPAAMAILVAFAYFYGDEVLRLYFVLPVKAKYVTALYLGIYLLVVVFSGDKFGALLALTNALCGWMFLKWVPRRGLRYAASEKWFGMRNDFHRDKRRRAAKEFEVYMRKQGKDVRVDDTDDKKWMN